MSPIWTIVGILSAAAGWFIAALLAYHNARKIAEQRITRERRGALREARTLLRRFMDITDPFFYSFMNLQLNDALGLYNDLSAFFESRDIVILLSDEEYDAIDAATTRLGQMVALSQKHAADEERSNEGRSPGQLEANAYRQRLEIRLFLAQSFRDALNSLDDALKLLGTVELQERYDEMMERADGLIMRNLEKISDPRI